MAKDAEAAEVDYTKYAGKAPSDLHVRFTDWIIQEVYEGDSPHNSKAAAAAFAEGVRLATILRMPFQRSPENQEDLAERRAASAEAAADKKPKKAAKAAKKTKPTAAEAEEEEEQTAPKRKAKKASAKSAAEESTESARPSRRPARRRAAADDSVGF